jgi:predicted dehydrogenase
MIWFSEALPGVTFTDYRDLLAESDIEAVYCAVPHHLHQQLYVDILRAGKHLLGEKPFGIDREGYQVIAAEMARRPDLLVRCSSEYPFFPGVQTMLTWAREGRFGRIFEIESGYWHCSDLNPMKPINWKRRVATCGEYGCIGDLGMHLKARVARIGGFGVAGLASVYVPTGSDRNMFLGRAEFMPTEDMALAVRRVTAKCCERIARRAFEAAAPTTYLGSNAGGMQHEVSKQLRYLPYTSGASRPGARWTPFTPPTHHHRRHLPIPGFTDAILQMCRIPRSWHGGDGMKQPFYCATPEEVAASHDLFTAALESQRSGQTVTL